MSPAKHQAHGQVHDSILDTPAIAAELRCSEQTVEELMRAGKLKGLRIGRPWVTLRSELVAYLQRELAKIGDAANDQAGQDQPAHMTHMGMPVRAVVVDRPARGRRRTERPDLSKLTTP